MAAATSKIVRRLDRATGGITDAEKALLDQHAQLWIQRAMRTTPIDPAKIVPAIEGLYAAAGLKTPRVVIVPSPLAMAIVGGFAAAIWYKKKMDEAAITRDATYATTLAATYDATDDASLVATDAATRNAADDATRNATDAATRNATLAATGDATRDATDDATRDATDDATYDATLAATFAATRNAMLAATDAATDAATFAATRNATYAATSNAIYDLAYEIGGPQLAPLMVSCVRNWWNSYQGGNMWAAWSAYLTAFRDVLGLRLPVYEKLAHWEQASIEGGFRWMHDEFCIVSDFPELLLKDDQNRPHNINGPSHRWRDGWSLYHVHGVRVPEYVVERPNEITVSLIDQEQNAEVRRVMIERYGVERYLIDSGAKIIARDAIGMLYRKDVHDDEPIVMVRVLNSTPEPDGVMSRDEAIATFGTAAKVAINAPDGSRFKAYMIRVPPSMRTAREAVAWTFNLLANEYHPELET